MHTETGKIVELMNDDQVALLKAQLTKLTQQEYEVISKIEQNDRPLELALMRFIEERKVLKAPMNINVKNAFRQGYLAALKDVKRE